MSRSEKSARMKISRSWMAAWISLVLGCTASPVDTVYDGEGEDTCPPEPSPLAFGTPETLDLVTWNIQEFPKAGQGTVTAVEEVLLGLDVDLFAFQEITDVPTFLQMADYMPGWEAYVESEWYGGLAYLYRTDTIEVIRNYEIYTTEEYWTAFPRSPQVMEFRFAGEDFVVIDNHFKCCGDGRLEPEDSWDEETRRRTASAFLRDYIDLHFVDRRVFVVGDLNDCLTDAPEYNAFQPFLDDPVHYRFADMDIATGDAADWSFPSYPSHLDHILVTAPLFDALDHPETRVQSILIDSVLFDGWWDYEARVSDHRPVALRLALGE